MERTNIYRGVHASFRTLWLLYRLEAIASRLEAAMKPGLEDSMSQAVFGERRCLQRQRLEVYRRQGHASGPYSLKPGQQAPTMPRWEGHCFRGKVTAVFVCCLGHPIWSSCIHFEHSLPFFWVCVILSRQ